jgi:small subunit ribosomal protein S5
MNNKTMHHKKGGRPQEEKPAFDQYILDLARVTRVTEGGKHLSFRACVILGDRKGRVAYGIAKGKDVQLGVEKAVRQAKKNFIAVPIVNETIPHWVESKFKAARVMLKPAPRGSGIIAGGAVRAVLELAGVPNVSSKILARTKNKILLVKATFDALKKFKMRPTKIAPVQDLKVKIEVEDPNDKIVKIKKKANTEEAQA